MSEYNHLDQISIRQAIMETMHSEHCSYKSTSKYLSRLYTKGKQVIQGPGENAGIVRLGGGYALAMRIESHNHPSAIEPFGGAATGEGGIVRDIITMGARPLGVLSFFRVGKDRRAPMLLDGVTRGVAFYGNTIGIPNLGGDTAFDESYNGNPLVNVACVGLVKEKDIIYGHALTPGNPMIYVGAKTGPDGTDGATYASREITDNEAKHVVQNGHPFLEKLLLEACVELAGTGWVEGMQDMGAAGILCSTTEPAHRGQRRTGKPIGAKIYLDRVPVSEPLTPNKILRSESQERMMIIGKKEHTEDILRKFEHWGLEAAVVGEVTGDGNYTLEYTENGQTKTEVMTIEEICAPVAEEWPLEKWQTQGGDYVMASANTTRNIWQQYDWRVGARTLKGPNEPGHYAILDLPEIDQELVLSWSSDEGRSDVDPTQGIKYAFDKAYGYQRKNHARALGITNCLNFGYPSHAMGAFVETVDELSRLCRKYRVPVVSGNVSLYNSYDSWDNEVSHGLRSIKPTPVLVMAGIREKTIS